MPSALFCFISHLRDIIKCIISWKIISCLNHSPLWLCVQNVGIIVLLSLMYLLFIGTIECKNIAKYISSKKLMLFLVKMFWKNHLIFCILSGKIHSFWMWSLKKSGNVTFKSQYKPRVQLMYVFGRNYSLLIRFLVWNFELE